MAEQVASNHNDNGPSTDCDLGDKRLPQMSEEDRQTVVVLYQQHPKMWKDFRLVLDLHDQLSEDPLAFHKSRGYLLQLLLSMQSTPDSQTHQVVLGIFCVAVGAVEGMVTLYRHICQERGKNYVIELSPPFADDATWCVCFLRSVFCAFSCFCMEFRLRLAGCGYLDFVMNDLRHMQHMSYDALKNSGVYIESMGTLFNCCRHPEVVRMLRQKPVLQDVLAFVDKEKFVIKGLALITMAFLVEDRDLDLIRLDCDTLQYFLDTTSASFVSQGRESEGWQTDAVVHGLSQFARNDVNCRRIVAQGGLNVLVRVLEEGIQVQREVVMDTLMALSRDPGNVHVFQRNRQLREALQRVKPEDHQALGGQASTLIATLSQYQSAAESKEESTDDSVCEFLRENSNVLEILDIGVVEYVLDHLDPGSTTCTGSQPFRQTLEALLHVAKDDNRKREVFSRGGLDLLKHHLEKEDDEGKEMVLNVVATLASTSENGEIVQSHRGLMKVMGVLAKSDNAATSQAARRLQHAIKDVTSAKGPQGSRLNKLAETP